MPRDVELSGPAERASEPSAAFRHLEELAILRDPNPGLLRASLHGLYDALWLSAALLGSPWLLYRAHRDRTFRRMVLERLGRGLGRLPRRDERPRVLVHGVSVGEVKGAQALVRAIEAAWPEVEVVLSVTTGTGLEVAEMLFPENLVVRFPFDLSAIVEHFLVELDPAFVVLVELEIWPNFLRKCNQRGVPIAVVNGRITEKSHARYHVFRELLPQFNRISLFCVQSREYAERFLHLGASRERVIVTGNVKADGLRVGRADPGEELARLLGPRGDELVLVAGSTHEPEERLVAAAARRALTDARLVLVPRHPRRADEVERSLATLGLSAQRLSRLRAGLEPPDPTRPAIVDTIGELERVYGLADLVFVGGSLVPHGGQNVLEPAAQGLGVVFGPSMENFTQEATLLLGAGAARQVGDEDELARVLAELAGDAALRERMGEAGRRAVLSQKGATGTTLAALSALAIERVVREARAPA